MKFLGKWMDLEGIILNEVTQSQKNSNDMYSLISGYYPRNLEYPRYKIQFAKHMKLKKNEDQSVDTLPLLRIENNHPWKEAYMHKWFIPCVLYVVIVFIERNVSTWIP